MMTTISGNVDEMIRRTEVETGVGTGKGDETTGEMKGGAGRAKLKF